MLRVLKYFFVTLFVLSLLCVAGIGAGLYYLVVVNPGPEIEQSAIEAILGRESPVFYRDGQEKVGVLFQDYHRQYLLYRQIPTDFVNAIVAAEDDQFFSHYGVDLPGIARAMIANFKAGRVVQGGSTITQQTAKNLFKRESRSYRAKLKELLYALRLEHRYSKEKILEFYTNQFFVSGNGHGLGVAARYYFDKEPKELNLLECAFIAGSVKRPNYYNPFTRKNRGNFDQTRRKAEQRAGYVLRKMLEEGMISQDRYNRAKVSDISFNKGKMTYALNTVMDLVKEGLAAPEITRALSTQGIANISTSGIQVITTVDRQLQAAALYALRRHLSFLDVQLRGFNREEIQKEYNELEYTGDSEQEVQSFLFGKITEVADDKEDGLKVVVSFSGGKPDGLIDDKGIERLVTAFAKFRKDKWAEAGKKDRKLLVKELQPGDRVYVSVRESDGPGPVPLDLERFPKVQGAALVKQEGAILAMSGGVTNRFFNRATDAKRLMGSTFKTFLFAAALQLGWNTVDLLENSRDVFILTGRPYFPRPDHHSPHEQVTMSWAGVKSENVAAVWLLYHLADNLTPPRLRELADHLDMAPRTNGDQVESYQQFRSRIRDSYGVVVTRNSLDRASYHAAVESLEADFLFDGRVEEYRQLEKLHYGLHFDRYAEELRQQLSGKGLRERQRKELRIRLAILRNNYLSLKPVVDAFSLFRQRIERQVDMLDSFSSTGAGGILPTEGGLFYNLSGQLVFSLSGNPPDDWRTAPESMLITRLFNSEEGHADRLWRSILLEGVVSAGAYEDVGLQMQEERNKLAAHQPYSLEVLAKIRDYRVMLGLQYLVHLGRECGIKSPLEAVLSFPLGSNVVSLAEAVSMYEALISGVNYNLSDHSVENNGDSTVNGEGLSIIERIEMPDGQVVYSRNPQEQPVFDRRTAVAVANILQNTVTYGTGRYAKEHVRLQSEDGVLQEELEAMNIPVPLMGKTGTANQFRNAAFMGYVPGLAGDNESMMAMDKGYTVGVYVGYDGNAPMVKGSTRVSGSQGALPVWSDIASALLVKDNVGDRLDPVDLTFNGLGMQYPEVDQVYVAIDVKKGGALRQGGDGFRGRILPTVPTSLTYGRLSGNGPFEPARYFQPFWKNKNKKASAEQ